MGLWLRSVLNTFSGTVGPVTALKCTYLRRGAV